MTSYGKPAINVPGDDLMREAARVIEGTYRPETTDRGELVDELRRRAGEVAMLYGELDRAANHMSHCPNTPGSINAPMGPRETADAVRELILACPFPGEAIALIGLCTGCGADNRGAARPCQCENDE